MAETREELESEGFVRVCTVEEVPTVMPKLVHVGGRGVLICKDGEEVYAVDEICPHKQKSMAAGIVFNGEITCPWHSYAFDLGTGRCKRRRCAPVEVYATRVIDGEVFVKV